MDKLYEVIVSCPCPSYDTINPHYKKVRPGGHLLSQIGTSKLLSAKLTLAFINLLSQSHLDSKKNNLIFQSFFVNKLFLSNVGHTYLTSIIIAKRWTIQRGLWVIFCHRLALWNYCLQSWPLLSSIHCLRQSHLDSKKTIWFLKDFLSTSCFLPIMLDIHTATVFEWILRVYLNISFQPKNIYFCKSKND